MEAWPRGTKKRSGRAAQPGSTFPLSPSLVTPRQASVQCPHPPSPHSRIPRLSVVIIAYNMAREIPRTLRSFSPAMQHGITAGDYEVILVDNGSTRPFDEGLVRQIMPNLRVHYMDEASPSPVKAINQGLAWPGAIWSAFASTARAMASPGLLANALLAARLHDRPVIGTLAFHLGPEGPDGQRAERLQSGAGRRTAAQCRLADRRLPPFRHFGFRRLVEGRLFVTPTETNALFLRAGHWRALGGYDEGFATPGGGLANLDMWKRACEDPAGKVFMLLGEATFHQVHGGVATNAAPIRRMTPFARSISRCAGRASSAPGRKPAFWARCTRP